jgi:hypothetical protein
MMKNDSSEDTSMWPLFRHWYSPDLLGYKPNTWPL